MADTPLFGGIVLVLLPAGCLHRERESTSGFRLHRVRGAHTDVRRAYEYQPILTRSANSAGSIQLGRSTGSFRISGAVTSGCGSGVRALNSFGPLPAHAVSSDIAIGSIHRDGEIDFRAFVDGAGDVAVFSFMCEPFVPGFFGGEFLSKGDRIELGLKAIGARPLALDSDWPNLQSFETRGLKKAEACDRGEGERGDQDDEAPHGDFGL